jgi:hypothetical protein
MEQRVFILFGEGLDTNVRELQAMLNDGWRVIQMCPMPSSISTMLEGVTRYYEPQCAVLIQKGL